MQRLFWIRQREIQGQKLIILHLFSGELQAGGFFDPIYVVGDLYEFSCMSIQAWRISSHVWSISGYADYLASSQGDVVKWSAEIPLTSVVVSTRPSCADYVGVWTASGWLNSVQVRAC